MLSNANPWVYISRPKASQPFAIKVNGNGEQTLNQQDLKAFLQQIHWYPRQRKIPAAGHFPQSNY